MIALTVKFLGPTDTRGARLKLIDALPSGKITMTEAFDHSSDFHRQAKKMINAHCIEHRNGEMPTGVGYLDDDTLIAVFGRF